MKRPSFQFYPADWRKDSALQACSLAARGLWMELMCVMHECDPYGVLALNGKPMSNAQIARLIGESPATIRRLLKELEEAGVFSRDSDGAIFSRRMVHDEHIREVRAKAGRLGGNPNLLKKKDKQKPNQSDKQIPTPSSSSSSSEIGGSTARTEISQSEREPDQHQLAPNFEATLRMKRAGCDRVNPTLPALIAAIEEGVTPEELEHCAREAIERGRPHPFAYAIAIARGRKKDGAPPAPGGSHATSTRSRNLGLADQAAHDIHERRQREALQVPERDGEAPPPDVAAR